MANLIKISEAASLGLHAMALLANRGKQRLTSQQIAGMLGASVHHLAKVMQKLAHAGLVDSVVGPQGGFRLDKAAGRIRLLTIYEAIEGSLSEPQCLLAKQICTGGDCMLGELVQRLNQEIRDYLRDVRLTTLAKGHALLRMLERVRAD